jgi:hypothetical protein
VDRLKEALPGCYVFIDTEAKGSLFSANQIWKYAFESGCEWVVVVQEDVILCKDFMAKAEKRCHEAAAMGYDVVQFCRMTKDRKASKDGRWVSYPASRFTGAQCNAYRFTFLRRLLQELETNPDEHLGMIPGSKGRLCNRVKTHDDGFVNLILDKMHGKFLETVPDLAQHDASMPSALGIPVTSRMRRVSFTYDENGD